MRKLDAIFAAAGLGLFAIVVWRIGWDNVMHQLKAMWIVLPLVVVVSMVRMLLQTWAWRAALQAERVPGNFRELFGIRVASQSLGYVAVGPALTEAMKVKLLGIDWEKSAAPTIVDTAVYWLTATLFAIVGCAAAGLVLVGSRFNPGLLAVTAVFALCGVFLMRQKPLLNSLIRLLGRRAPGWLIKAAGVEQQIRTFRTRHPAAVRSMMWLDLLCQIMLMAETAMVLYVARLPVQLPALLAIEAAARLTKIAASWVPARLGADESGTIAAFAAFGLSPAAGLLLALTRRCRDLLFCAAGLGWLVWHSRRTAQPAPNRVPDASRNIRFALNGGSLPCR